MYVGVLICSPGWPQTCALASPVLGLQACTTTPGLYLKLNKYLKEIKLLSEM
jgi:hypothetical protein